MGQTKHQKSRGNYKLNEVWPDNYNVEESEYNTRIKGSDDKRKWDVDRKPEGNYWVDVTPWTYRKETKLRDKYLKVRVRYTGNQLAVIQAVLTTYTESYA